MRAVTIAGPGGPEKLTISTVPNPILKSGFILVDVAAAGVNRADLLQRAGHYPPPPGAPPWPGLEISGTVAAIGPGVIDFRPGDAVVALVDGGGYAEQVAVPAGQVLPVPDGVGLVDAAALPEAACTAWSNLVDVAHLSAGEWVLVHGGSGGIGSIAIQLAVALGARVATTAGGADRGARCRALGAEVVVDHRGEDFVAAVHDATGGRGVDVVLDIVGAAYLERNLTVLARYGRLVVIGLQKGRRAEVDLRLLMAKSATISGTMLRSRTAQEKAQIVADVGRWVWPMIADGRVRPVIGARIPLAEAARAHELMESGDAFGKVLLVP